MEFAFTEEQNQFRDVVKRFCRDKSPTTTVRKVMETDAGFDPEVWRQMCGQLGLAAIHVPEQRGGGGFGAVELGIVMEEHGRVLLPAPYLSSVLAASALAEVDESTLRDPLMEAVTSADKVATLVLDPVRGYPVTAEITVESGRLTGTAKAVLDAHRADLLLVIAGHGSACGLYALEVSADGVEVRALRTMDRTRRFAEVSFRGVTASLLSPLSREQVEHIYHTALVALSNEMVGGAQALLAATVEYTKLRVQFGRAIGSFQAIKHRLADLLVDVELARVAAYQAAAALDAGEEVAAIASLAKFTAAEAYMNAAREAIQLHGGIGFTWENDTHLWYRRAKSSEVFLGTPAYHRERMMEAITA